MATQAPKIEASSDNPAHGVGGAALVRAERVRLAVLCATIVASAILLFWRQLVLISDLWFSDGALSIGVLVPLVSGAFAIRAWKSTAGIELRPSAGGFLLAFASALTVIGLNRLKIDGRALSMLLIPLFLAGAMASLAGWRFVREFTFPLAFLWFMLPLPPPVLALLDQPLQLVCARVVESVAHLLHMPVIRSGTIVGPSLSVAVDIAPECNGVRSAITILTLSVILARLKGLRVAAGVVLSVLGVGLAYTANFMRLCTLFVMMDLFRDSFMNYEHAFDLTSGALWFLLAVLCLLSIASRLPHRSHEGLS